ncbi:hypothetical protein CONPUDRAFT_142444 [Coniophora puteana RWD-64-598 SS2]|uniref:Ca3427-like PBP 2 domain-containing protein n=1 Tax=Coniophora puteana (strain RWD-64-598) TaxID=741705 RepID=A0A5M3MY37_CONPW|nr:uncharacterized protein CONPUDRAFT_142444 [Coniophora puteana RWD-64-598 SS2]EIW83946.1 hypothetical protein CONPUDRAFT_142444 [Coniophora puteana RWD-64-598 SS2]
MVLKIGYVREHFATPLLQYYAEQPKDNAGKPTIFELDETGDGTGKLIKNLKAGEIDIAVQAHVVDSGLTESLIKGIVDGSKEGSEAYKIVGLYVTSPLRWAVITGNAGGKPKYKDISELDAIAKSSEGKIRVGISRPGSGSQNMAYVLAHNRGWHADKLEWIENGKVDPLMASVNAPKGDANATDIFMWEWITTRAAARPEGATRHDNLKVHFVDEVLTPWPSWLIVASTKTIAGTASADAVKAFLEGLNKHIRAFSLDKTLDGPNFEFLKKNFSTHTDEDLQASPGSATDVREWLGKVSYPESCLDVPSDLIQKTLKGLEDAKALQLPSGGYPDSMFLGSFEEFVTRT